MSNCSETPSGHRVTQDDTTPLPNNATREDFLFYDGHCGLCHRSVKFILKHDKTGEAFTFCPLQGDKIKELLDEQTRANLPDSMIVLTRNGHLLTKSDAALHIAKCLGGSWRFMSTLGRIIPRPIRNFMYDCIARMRHKLFTKPKEACPMLPPELRERFVF